MSGWNLRDNMLEVDTGDDYPASNNITLPGALPHDEIPSPAKSRSMVEAHFKSLRMFRRYCRYMPFLIGFSGYRNHTSVQQAKLQVAAYWRTQNKVRNSD